MSGVEGDLVVRRARAVDARAVTRLLLGIYREHDFFVGDGPASERHLARRLEVDDKRRTLYLTAWRQTAGREELCGWLELHRAPAWRLEHVAVLTLAVAPEHRRIGVASELLSRADDWCHEVGVVKISLHVRAGNRAALALYQREGFELEGRERGQIRRHHGATGSDAADGVYSAEQYEDNLIMGKWLRVDSRS